MCDLEVLQSTSSHSPAVVMDTQSCSVPVAPPLFGAIVLPSLFFFQLL